MSLVTSCSNQNMTSSDSILSENARSETQDTIQSDSDIATKDKIQGSEKIPDQLEEKTYIQAMEKWIALGGNNDFKNIESLDTLALVKICSSYFMQANKLDFTRPEVWLDLSEFDGLVSTYFDLPPEQFHHPHEGTSYDPQKGFAFYSKTSILPENATHELGDCSENGDGTYYFEMLTTFELPRELIPIDQSNIIERTTRVTFKYEDETVYFLEASYEQDGMVL